MRYVSGQRAESIDLDPDLDARVWPFACDARRGTRPYDADATADMDDLFVVDTEGDSYVRRELNRRKPKLSAAKPKVSAAQKRRKLLAQERELASLVESSTASAAAPILATR